MCSYIYKSSTWPIDPDYPRPCPPGMMPSRAHQNIADPLTLGHYRIVNPKEGPWVMWVRLGQSDEFWSDSMSDPMTQGHYIVYSNPKAFANASAIYYIMMK